jgi:hypothetical protein
METGETIAIAGAIAALATPINTFLTYLIVKRQRATQAAIAENTCLTVHGNKQVEHLHTCVETRAEEIKAAVQSGTDTTIAEGNRHARRS